MRRLTGKIMIFAALALLLAAAASSRGTSSVVGKTTVPIANSHGLYYLTAGTATNVKTLTAKVVASPRQKVLLQWSMVCSEHASTDQAYDPNTKSKSGQQSVTSPGSAVMPMAYPHPKSCTVTLYAKMTKKATSATVSILKT